MYTTGDASSQTQLHTQACIGIVFRQKSLTRRWCGLWERNVQQRSYGDNLQPSYRNVAQHAACTLHAILTNPQVRISVGDPGSSITRGKSGRIRDIFSMHRATRAGLGWVVDKEPSQLFEVQYNDRERAELLYRCC